MTQKHEQNNNEDFECVNILLLLLFRNACAPKLQMIKKKHTHKKEKWVKCTRNTN